MFKVKMLQQRGEVRPAAFPLLSSAAMIITFFGRMTLWTALGFKVKLLQMEK